MGTTGEGLRPRCFFLDQAGACDGPMDRAHLVPKQRIKREFKRLPASDLHLLVWDDRVWVWACRFHHAQFDNFRFRVARHELPPAVEQWAAEHGLVWSLMRDYR